MFTLASGQEIPVIVTTKRGVRNITLRPKTVPVPEIHISKPWVVSDRPAINFLEANVLK